MFQTPAHSVRADFARALQRAFPGRRLVVVGEVNPELATQLAELKVPAIVCGSTREIADPPPDNGVPPACDTAVWIYPKSGVNDESEAVELARLAAEIVLLPAPRAEVETRRPEVVEALRTAGFIPDYGADLSDLDRSAIRLLRAPNANGESMVPAVESAFARLHHDVSRLERTLRTRMSELEAADRHIARLEHKLLSLKEAKRELKKLKQEKQALRKSPERKIGQVLLAPYRLPQRLLREVGRRMQRPEEPPPEVASAAEYQAWLAQHRVSGEELQAMRETAGTFKHAPLISVLTPVFNTPVTWLQMAIDSVIAQAYENWELILSDDASTDEATLAALQGIAARDPRIRLVCSAENGGISAASNKALEVAQGDWIGILDHDDLLEPDALFRTAELLQQHPEADLIYSDEDKLTEHGFDSPLFKPDWSPDFFLSYNYLCHLTTVRRTLVDQAGGFRSEFDGAQDYDLFLRIIEKTDRIHHIPRILYHWRRSDSSTSDNIRRKPGALEAGKAAITEHLRRRGESGYVAVDWQTQAYSVQREITNARRVCVIIPTRDCIPLLARCIDSLVEKTGYQNYEIVIVNNDSTTEEAREYFARTPHRVLHFEGPFNYSAINNFAVDQTDAPWLLFLNNDIEIIEADWLNAMVAHVQRREVGAVGARLLYPDGTVQHAGVVFGVGGVAQHAFRHFPGDAPGVARQLQVTRNYSAVTGACLLTRREVFDEVGGFDEERLPVTFNDVDLCLKMRRAGYLIVYTPFAKLYHHESATRRPGIEEREGEVMRERWPDLLKRDPYYNPNLARVRADFSLGEIPAKT